MSMKDVHLIVNKKFDVDYSLKQIGKIVKKLGYNYSKAYPKFSKSPEDAEEQLKKLKRTQRNNKRYYSLI